MKVRIVGLVAMSLIAIIAVGCGSEDSNTPDTSKSASANNVDTMFVTGMIPHHEAAVEMAELGVQKAEHPEIKELSQAIIQSQTSEISTLKTMRESMPAANSSMMSGEEMMEMEDQVSSLKNADEFDLAFIDAMIPHHQSAVMMANQQITSGSNAKLRTMSRAIVKAQSKEIADMQSWRKEWYGSPLPTESTAGSMHSGH